MLVLAPKPMKRIDEKTPQIERLKIEPKIPSKIMKIKNIAAQDKR
jgi:hypothetical protein